MLDLVITANPSFDRLATAFYNVQLTQALVEHLDSMAESVERYSKQVTPVDSGMLRASIAVGGIGGSQIATRNITAKVSKKLGLATTGSVTGLNKFQRIVGTDVEYAGYVHNGTTRNGKTVMRARPFMQFGYEYTVMKFTDRTLATKLDKEFRRQFSIL